MVAKLTSIRGFIDSIGQLPKTNIKVVEDTVNFFGKKILKRHFDFDNRTKYNMPPLTIKYDKQKRKKWGNKPMMVASGSAKRRILATARALKLSPKRVNLIIKAPPYMLHHLNGSGPLPVRNWLYPNKRDMRDLIRFAKTRIRFYRKKSIPRR